MTTAVVRCRRCRHPLVRPEWVAVELGETCARRLGLVLAKRPRIRAPARERVGELLDGWEDLADDETEINERGTT